MINGRGLLNAKLNIYSIQGAVIAKEVIEEAVELAVKEHNVEFRYATSFGTHW